MTLVFICVLYHYSAIEGNDNTRTHTERERVDFLVVVSKLDYIICRCRVAKRDSVVSISFMITKVHRFDARPRVMKDQKTRTTQ